MTRNLPKIIRLSFEKEASTIPRSLATVTPAEIAWILRQTKSRSSQENWLDPVFLELAGTLQAYFRTPFSSDLVKNAGAIPAYIDLLRNDLGVASAMEAVRRLDEAGAPPRALATASQVSARNAGEYEIAVSTAQWLAERHPSDGIVSVVLAKALAATGRYNLLEEESRRASETIELSQWAIQEWARLLVDCCQFAAAEPLIARIENRQLRELLRLRVSSFNNARGAGEFPLPTYVINLATESRKLELTQNLMKKGGYQVQRAGAVDGRELPLFALERIADPGILESQGAGAVATALSHIHLWEKLLFSSEDRFLVIEDDATPYVHWSYARELVEGTLSTDLLWVNERMSMSTGSEPPNRNALVDPWAALGNRPPNLTGVGADGYVISRRGAERLLEFVGNHGIRGHIDGQMGAYAIGGNHGQAVNRTQKVVARLHETLGRASLTSQCLALPLVKTNDHGASLTTEVSRSRRPV